jgi:hypothetical protein
MLRGLSVIAGVAAALGLAACSPAARPAGGGPTAQGASPEHSPGYGDFSADGDLGMSVVLHVRLSAAGRFERGRIYPVQFTGEGQPVPGGGAVAFIARLSAQDFGGRAARILPSGVIRTP